MRATAAAGPRALLIGCLVALTSCTATDQRPANPIPGRSAAPTAEDQHVPELDTSELAALTALPRPDGYDPDRAPLLVKIDNHESARPQIGIRSADIVIEIRVEGGQSRFLAVFHSRIPPTVGPIRSTRSSDFDLLRMFPEGIYASSGGNRGILRGLEQVPVIDVGANRTSLGFSRSASYVAPHDLIATTADLIDNADGGGRPAVPQFRYAAGSVHSPRAREGVRSASIRFGAEVEHSRWVWNQDDETWHRHQAGSPHTDSAGDDIAPTNVVVLEIDYEFVEAQGRSRPHGITVGAGITTVLTRGQVFGGRWSRPTPEDHFDLSDPMGRPMLLAPGQTFVVLIPRDDNLTISYEDGV